MPSNHSPGVKEKGRSSSKFGRVDKEQPKYLQAKVAPPMYPPKEPKKVVAKQSKSKNHPVQNRISVVGASHPMPPQPPVNYFLNPPPAAMPVMSNFKTFYNWNSNTDYNYEIDTRGPPKPLGFPEKKNIILEEEGDEENERENCRKSSKSPRQSYRGSDKKVTDQAHANIAKLLHKKNKQMEDTGGDYIEPGEVRNSPMNRIKKGGRPSRDESIPEKGIIDNLIHGNSRQGEVPTHSKGSVLAQAEDYDSTAEGPLFSRQPFQPGSQLHHLLQKKEAGEVYFASKPVFAPDRAQEERDNHSPRHTEGLGIIPSLMNQVKSSDQHGSYSPDYFSGISRKKH